VERQGTYIEFQSTPGFDLIVQSLDVLRSGIRLQNVRKQDEQGLERTLATVYVPNNKRRYFLSKIRAYATEINERSKRPKNYNLVNSIDDIRLAVLESFWRPEERSLIPGNSPDWVEVWLSSDQDQVVSHFEPLLRSVKCELKEGILKFPERTVMLIRANRSQLKQLVECSDDIAEFRGAKKIASFYVQMDNRDQLVLVQRLLARTIVDRDSDVAVCILDTGVNNGHLLIQPVLNPDDLHAVRGHWGTNDDDGHGTLMAGTAAYGDLSLLLDHDVPVNITHCIESAKILPPPPDRNAKELWGYFTAQGISLAEIQAPTRKRIGCIAVTSEQTRDQGKPSSWSAKLDEIASGYEDDTRRLILISAGNVSTSDDWRNYSDANLSNEVHDPGQAWNALTIGAFTEKIWISDPTYKGYKPIAPSGGLSPYSTTSTAWPSRKWPIKPEVVFEGGNVARSPDGSAMGPDDLQLFSTYYKPQEAQFATFCATSAACAQAAWMAAQIQAQYPDAWPETIRALIVHSAGWTGTLKRQFLGAGSKSDYARLLRICGYGVPKLNDALYCLSNSLTLISQAELTPFEKKIQESIGRDGTRKLASRYISREMHLYNLPWPKDTLTELGAMQVTMRITLSYFIEPSPGEVGWEDRYRYASHGLRFEVNGPGESESEFVQRVNEQARDDGEHPGTEGIGGNWLIGAARNVGSIHSDIWHGRAADLAGSNLIAVYPSVGWWRERHHLNRWSRRTRYTLIVSIYTPQEDIDIYTPVAVQIGLPVTIEIPARRKRG